MRILIAQMQAGAIAAFTVDLIVYPLDTLKTRMQSRDYARLYTNAATKAINKPALFRGLYQGVGSVIIATLPSCMLLSPSTLPISPSRHTQTNPTPAGAFFTTYERTKSLLNRLNPTTASSPHGLLPTPLLHALASSTAELVSCAILTPAEVIKQNAQMASSASTAPNATLATLAGFRSNPLALWRGYTALAGRNLPFTALQFPLFERLKRGIREGRDKRGLSRGGVVESGCITAVAAGCAGAVSAVVTTPVDVVKTRIMLAAGTEGKEKGGSGNDISKGKGTGRGFYVDALGKGVQSSKDTVKDASKALNPLTKSANNGRKSAWAIGQEIVQETGVRGLWRGGALRGVWTMIGSGLYLGAYESGRIYLASRRGKNLKEEDLF
jgi:hypothetical protein